MGPMGPQGFDEGGSIFGDHQPLSSYVGRYTAFISAGILQGHNNLFRGAKHKGFVGIITCLKALLRSIMLLKLLAACKVAFST